MMKQLIVNKLNRTVFELWTGILAFGILCSVVAFFVNNPGLYILCLLIGILSALAAGYHMWWSIDRALDLGEEGATKSIRLQFLIRYLFLTAVLAFTGIFFGSYVLAAFLGILGIKVGSYLQPVSKKLSTAIYGEEILPDIIEFIDDDDDVKK